MFVKPHSYAEINLKNLRFNIREIKAKINLPFFPVIKTDAYGVGLKNVAKVLSEEGINHFLVSDLNEAFVLEEEKISGDFVILNPLLSKEIKEGIKRGFVIPVWDKGQLKEIESFSKKMNKKPRIQIEIDTGMGRCGIPVERAHSVVDGIINNNIFERFGIFTHFSKAEDDKNFTEDQLGRFINFINPYTGDSFKFIHASNSASVLKLKDKVTSFPFNSFRLGLLLYGVMPCKSGKTFLNLKPVVKIKAKIIKVDTLRRGSYIGYGAHCRLKKNTSIGVVAFGYARGIIRNSWKNGYFIAGKKRVKILGTISMDLTVVDLSRVPEIKSGDEVVIIGKEGKEEITFNEFAEWSGSIPHEVFVKLTSSLPKVYKK